MREISIVLLTVLLGLDSWVVRDCLERPVLLTLGHVACSGPSPFSFRQSLPDPQLKRAVLDTIAKRKSPKLIPHIIKARQDPRPDVYPFAMAKVLKLQEEFQGEIARAIQSSPSRHTYEWNH